MITLYRYALKYLDLQVYFEVKELPRDGLVLVRGSDVIVCAKTSPRGGVHVCHYSAWRPVSFLVCSTAVRFAEYLMTFVPGLPSVSELDRLVDGEIRAWQRGELKPEDLRYCAIRHNFNLRR